MATWRAPRGLCKKCGGGYATHFYHEAGDCIGRRNRRDDEHLHYICSRCGYDWCVDVWSPPTEPVWTWWAVSAAVGFGLLFIVAVIVAVLLIVTNA